MSVPFLTIASLALFAVVSLFCFAGCGFEGTALEDFKEYSNVTVLAHPHVAAYWPLGDATGDTTAHERKSGRDGAYVDVTTAPEQFPYPALPNSVPAPGTLLRAQPGMLRGDLLDPTGDPNDLSQRTTCVLVNGGYVRVPFDPALNPSSAFTVEVWVSVHWDALDPAAFRIVLDATEGGNKGFVLWANQDNRWEAVVGNGGAGDTATTKALGEPVSFGTTSHLVMTFDGTNLMLYVDGQQSSATTPAIYVPNPTSPLYIGTGVPYIPVRPQPPGIQAGPLFPFEGRIQAVAVYDAALALEEVIAHYHNGNGIA